MNFHHLFELAPITSLCTCFFIIKFLIGSSLSTFSSTPFRFFFIFVSLNGFRMQYHLFVHSFQFLVIKK